MIKLRPQNKRIHFSPICNKGKLIVESKEKKDTEIEMINITNDEDAKWFIKCPMCKNQIGLVINNITILQYKNYIMLSQAHHLPNNLNWKFLTS